MTWTHRIALAALLLAPTLAHAADAPPPPPPTAKIEITAQDAQVIALALDKAAATCASDTVACQIGMFKAPIIAKLNAAVADMQKAQK